MSIRNFALVLVVIFALTEIPAGPGAMLSPPIPSAIQQARCWGGESMPPSAEPTGDRDEQFLKYSKIPTDAPGLLNYLKERSGHDQDLLNLDRLIRQLAADDFGRRDEASRKLIALGPPAHAALLQAQKDKDQERARRAKECAEQINRAWKPGLNLTVVRRLVKLHPPGVEKALLQFLPYAADEECEEEIWFGLDNLAKEETPASLPPGGGGLGWGGTAELLADKFPIRRAAAGYLLTRRGNAEQRATAKKLLGDPDPLVRVRTAQGLLGAKDKEAIPVLIDLMEKLPAPLVWQAEAALYWVAGDDAPENIIGSGSQKSRLESRLECCQAWQTWWSKHAPSLDIGRTEGSGRKPSPVSEREYFHQRVELVRFLRAERLRFSFSDTPLLDAIEDVSKKTELAIAIQGNSSELAKKRITLDTGRCTLWEALDYFNQKAGLVERGIETGAGTNSGMEVGLRRLVTAGGITTLQNRLLVKEGNAPVLPTCYPGSFRIRALAPHPAYGGTLAPAEKSVVLEVSTEPHLIWQRVRDIRITRAIAENGQMLTPIMKQLANEPLKSIGDLVVAWREKGQFINDPRQVRIVLKTPPERCNALKELEGIIVADVHLSQPVVIVEPILQAAGQTSFGIGGCSVQVLGVNRDPAGNVNLRVEIRNPPCGAGAGVARRRIVEVDESNVIHVDRKSGLLVGTADPTISLIDAKDKDFQLLKFGHSALTIGLGGGDFQQQLELLFKPHNSQAEAAKLVFNGLRLVTLQIPFTLKDVPLSGK